MKTTFRDREILTSAQEKGPIATLGAYLRLSGPGWLQSAITLGGGSLIGCLYLGMLGGNELLWLQVVAILIGLIMLSAISYVTLSSDLRPYQAINSHINPVLGIGWLTATILANMIWILPQFSLCYDALDKNLMPGVFEEGNYIYQSSVSAILAVAAIAMVWFSLNPGFTSRFFDLILKFVIMAVLVSFVIVVAWLAQSNSLSWSEIASGFIPRISHWSQPTAAISELLASVQIDPEYWQEKIVQRQQESMISVAATAVGINMTFLLPYSMLQRGWDKPFRGLSRFDLVVGLTLPFLIVTACIVIASGNAFHAKADQNLLSEDPQTVKESVLFKNLIPVYSDRLVKLGTNEDFDAITSEISILKAQEADADADKLVAVRDLLDESEQRKADIVAAHIASVSAEERKISAALVKPNVAQLAATLEPLLGQKNARLFLGLGALGMGFSTIIILMLTNSLAFAEVSGRFDSMVPKMTGAIAAAIIGSLWFVVWNHESKTYLVIAASMFGAILLPIAYITFFALMNSSKVLGDEKPKGGRLITWNILMAIAVVGAIVQAYGGVATNLKKPIAGPIVIGGLATFVLLAIVGFSARQKTQNLEHETE